MISAPKERIVVTPLVLIVLTRPFVASAGMDTLSIKVQEFVWSRIPVFKPTVLIVLRVNVLHALGAMYRNTPVNVCPVEIIVLPVITQVHAPPVVLSIL